MSQEPYQNPFTVGRTVSFDCFVGRLSEIDTAFDQIRSKGNLAIWGNPGMGKSSFLEYLASPEAWQLRGLDSVVIVKQSCLGILPFSESGFWREVLIQLQDAFETKPELSELKAKVSSFLSKEKINSADLRQVLRRLGEKKKSLVLLVDDYDVALREHQNYNEFNIKAFLGECRKLVAHCPESRYLSMVVTSIRRLNDIQPKLNLSVGSPWFNHYAYVSLKPFKNSDVDTLLGCMPMTLALKEAIRDIAGGNPALLQHAGYLLYRELYHTHQGQPPNPDPFIRDFLSNTKHFFEDTWNLASPVEQTLLMLIALADLSGRLRRRRFDLSDVEIIFSQKELELRDLEERGVLIHKNQDGKQPYRFASAMMQWWVVKQIENSDEEWLQEREKVFFDLMSHKRAESVGRAIRMISQHRDELPNLLEYFGRVVKAFPKGLLP